MELALRLTAATTPATDGLPLPPVPMAIVVGLGLAMLAFGVAHARGRFRRLAEVWIVSPYEGLVIGWLGAGMLLVLLGAVLLAAGGPVVQVLGITVAVAGAACWVLGLVALVRMPRRLRPRWLVEQVERDPGRMREPRRRARRRSDNGRDGT